MTNHPLSSNDPLVQEAQLNARALITARIAPGPPNPVYCEMLGAMMNRVADMAAIDPASVITLYGAQLSALATLAAEAICAAADRTQGTPNPDDVAADFFRRLDE